MELASNRTACNKALEPYVCMRTLRRAQEATDRLQVLHVSTEVLPQKKRPVLSHGPIIREENTHTKTALSRKDCPFAAMGSSKSASAGPIYSKAANLPTPSRSSSPKGRGRRSQRASFNDPLRPEIQVSRPASPAESAASAPACPIRFLDQHSPEEVAKYFEKHKHELPRSHEICVKRFQTNSASIRELDSKYGNLVAMIQGLGEKHIPMLPRDPTNSEDVDDGGDEASREKIRRWNRTVSDSVPRSATDPAGDASPRDNPNEDVEERTGHFDRPLKEIRVGESPSRPWGVHIPYHKSEASSAAKDLSDVAYPGGRFQIEATHETSQEPISMPEKKCPFSRGQARGDDNAGMPAVRSPDMGKQETTPRTVSRAIEHQPVPPELKHDHAHTLSGQGVLNHIINNGVVVISGTKLPKDTQFTNNGTLILGFPAPEAKALMENR